MSSSRAAGDRNPSPKPKAPDAPVGVSEGDARIFFWRPKLGGVLPECVHPYFSGCSGSVDAPEIRREGPNCAGAAEWRESALPCRGATECSVIVSRGTGCPSSPGAIGGKCLYLSVCCRGGYSASWLLIRRHHECPLRRGPAGWARACALGQAAGVPVDAYRQGSAGARAVETGRAPRCRSTVANGRRRTQERSAPARGRWHGEAAVGGGFVGRLGPDGWQPRPDSPAAACPTLAHAPSAPPGKM